MKTKLLVVLLALVMLSMPTQAEVQKGPYLIYNGNNTQMEVLWQLDAEQTCTIEWGEDTNYGSGSETTTELLAVVIDPEQGPVEHRHRFTIANLTPGTKYCYRVTDGDSVMYTGSFTAAPDADATKVKILAFGDTRTRPSKMNDVTGQMINTYTNDEAFQTIALHSGDWNDNDSLDAWENEFFNRHYPNNLQFQAEVPIAGARGNHDGRAYTHYGLFYPYPYVAGCYWSFDYGPIHVAVIEDIPVTGTVQHTWLMGDLAGSDKPWKIAVYHVPAWTSGWHSNNANAINHLHPLFVENNVPLIINGHNHNYVRCPVDGIHHITSGGGGAPLYSFYETNPYVVACARALHHCEIVIDGDTLNFTAVDAEGNVIDSFELVGATDEDAPTPDPMTFATAPTADSTSIAMEASEAIDPSGVEYYFTCTDGGGHDSGWQDDTAYTDTDIAPGMTYTYTVMARDKSVNHNTTAASSPASATLEADTVKIGRAKYSIDRGELKVEATSNLGGDVTLNLTRTSDGYDYGEMTYYATQDIYKYSAKPVANPGVSVTVTSTGGGADTKEVKSK